MKIIVSLYVYQFHLFVSYLNGGVDIVPFNDQRGHLNQNRNFLKKISAESSFLELQGINNTIYTSSNDSLLSIDLRNGAQELILMEDIHEPLKNISQLSIDYDYRNLYALSENDGIYKLNIKGAGNQSVEEKFIPKIFETIGNPVVSNLVARNQNIFLALRNYGISLISVDGNNILERVEIRTSDPQDVKSLLRHNLAIIADSEDGLLIYDLLRNEFVQKVKLPNQDFPQQIEISYNNIIVKGSKGLYYYNLNDKKFTVIREGKVGTFAIYYNYVFFTSQGKIFAYSSNDTFENTKFTIDRSEFDVSVLHK
jgi:outer membrane protein assembly factor BamB